MPPRACPLVSALWAKSADATSGRITVSKVIRQTRASGELEPEWVKQNAL